MSLYVRQAGEILVVSSLSSDGQLQLTLTSLILLPAFLTCSLCSQTSCKDIKNGWKLPLHPRQHASLSGNPRCLAWRCRALLCFLAATTPTTLLP